MRGKKPAINHSQTSHGKKQQRIFNINKCNIFVHGNAYAYKTYEFIWKLSYYSGLNGHQRERASE